MAKKFNICLQIFTKTKYFKRKSYCFIKNIALGKINFDKNFTAH